MSTRILTIAITVAVLLGACSSDESADQAAPQPVGAPTEVAPEPAPAAAAVPAAPGAVHVLAGSTSLGDLLVGPDGRTLYGFTNDVDAASTCYGTCADAWPPVIVPADWTAGPGLDFGIFATTVREDGQHQLVAGKWPLYYFAGDAAPGDITGQASGDVWFAVDLSGRLITEASAPDSGADTADDEAATDDQPATPSSVITTATTDLGATLVDAEGFTLYGFTDDTDGVPSCYDACADAWPPLLVGGTDIPAGLDPEIFSIVPRDDGTNQLVAGMWPLYRFAADAEPGDIKGQGSGGAWFAADPDGLLITTVEPTASVTVEPETGSTTVSEGYGNDGS